MTDNCILSQAGNDNQEDEDDGYTPPQEDYLPPGLKVGIEYDG